MKTLLICAMGVLLALELCAENIRLLQGYRGLRIGIGLLPALAGICYAVWVKAAPLTWDLPTRLALAGCLFPLLTAVEKHVPTYKKLLTWGLAVIYVILLLLNLFKG